MGVLVWSQAWLGLARGEDGSGGSTGGGGAVRTGRGGAKKRAEGGNGAGGGEEGAQEELALALWSWSSDRNILATNLRVHGAARTEARLWSRISELGWAAARRRTAVCA